MLTDGDGVSIESTGAGSLERRGSFWRKGSASIFSALVSSVWNGGLHSDGRDQRVYIEHWPRPSGTEGYILTNGTSVYI